MAHQTTFITKLSEIGALSSQSELEKVVAKYPLKCTTYYLNLINLQDPFDPLRRIVLPHIDELVEWKWGKIDPSNEKAYTVLEGVQHKYDSTVLLLVSNTCAGLCRYCFRKRLFLEEGKPEILKDIEEAIKYIRLHPEITNVILSGGDALMLSTSKLKSLIQKIREISHVGIIRIGTKVPSYWPQRIIGDYEFLETIKRYSTPEKRIYIMAHFDHPRELTSEAIRACHLLMKAGAIILNQTPLIRGVNDSPEVLASLFKKLTFLGIAPYYVFQCRPTVGNRPYAVPIEEGYQIFETAKSLCSGLAKRARFTMSHEKGKIEILGVTEEEVIFKFHRAAENKNSSKILIFKRNPEAYWLDDYEEKLLVSPLESEVFLPKWYV